jgi:hypothetical protein
VNALDEVPQSYSHQGNLELDQTTHTTETWDHESMDSEMIMLLLRVYAFCEEEKHAIMDCPFVPFHIRACIVRHVELQNVVGTLIDQPHEWELGIPIIQNSFKDMELGSQLGPQNQHIRSFIWTKSKKLEGYSHPHIAS